LIRTRDQPCNCCGSAAREPIARGVDFEYATCANEFEFVRCADCGHLYLNPQPDPSELGVIYPPDYGNYASDKNEAFTYQVKNWLDRRYLRRLTRGMRVERILDVGCADGRLLGLCRETFARAERLEGIEFSPTVVERARAQGYVVH